jgi:hypothetical protein
MAYSPICFYRKNEMTASSSSGNGGNMMDVSQVANNQLVDVSKVDHSNVKYLVVDGQVRMFEQIGASAAAGIKSENSSSGSNSSASSADNSGLRAFHWEKATDDQAAEYNRNMNQGNGKTGQSSNGKVGMQSSNGKVTGVSNNTNSFFGSGNNNLYVKHYDESIKAA